MFDTLLHPLFQTPFAVGLVQALLLPLIGCWLRLRDEWLAALALAHLAAAGALAGLVLGQPALAGALAAALTGSAARRVMDAGNSGYALLLLAGWSLALLLAANTPVGEALGQALVDGQLYFTAGPHLLASLGLLALGLALLPWLNRRLLRARLFPHHERANRLPAWRWHLGFDLLAAMALAVGTTSVGLMATFALVFLPPWVAFRLAGNWRGTLLLSALLGLVAYLLAFFAALRLDQPFGPTLVVILLLMGLAGRVLRRREP